MNETMEKLKSIFDGKQLSYEDLEKYLNEKGLKLGELQDGKYISQEKYNKSLEDKKELENKYNEALELNKKHSKDIEKLSKENISKEEFDKRIIELNSKHSEELESQKKAMEEMARNGAINNALDKFSLQPNGKEVVNKLIDTSKIKVDEKTGEVYGLDEQMKSIMTNHSYLFQPMPPAGATPGAANTTSATTSLSEEKQKMLESEKEAFYKMK